MFERVLRIKFVTFKNCFVYLSPSQKDLNTGVSIKITYNDGKIAYFSASIINNAVDDESIGINPRYAKVLGLNENEFVNVCEVHQLPVVNSISIQPLTQSDYEVLELLSQSVQSNLLDQVRVVNASQKLIIWIGNNLFVSVNVENIKPISPGMLDFLSEVVIIPPDKLPSTHKLLNNKALAKKDKKSQLDIFFKRKSADASTAQDRFTNADLYCCRLLPLSYLPIHKNQSPFTFNAFACENNFFSKNESENFFKIELLNNLDPKRNVYLKIKTIESSEPELTTYFLANNERNIFVDDSIFDYLESDLGARVALKKVTSRPQVTEIEVHSKKSYTVNVVEELKKYLAKHCSTESIVLNTTFPIKLNHQLLCSLRFLDGKTSSDFCIIDSVFLRECSYSVCEGLVSPLEETSRHNWEGVENICLDIGAVKNIYAFVESVLFGKGTFQRENIIITGNLGTGKTTLLRHIAKKVRSYPYFVNTELVSCKTLKGKTIESLHKFFGDVLSALIFYQPALLLLDDLHVLAEQAQSEESPNAVYTNRVSEQLFALFTTVQRQHHIGIVASVISLSNLNKHLYKSRGNHLFKNVVSVQNLNKIDRLLLLKHFLGSNLVDSDVDCDVLALKTGGFAVQDIEDLSTKSLFEAHKESRRDNMILKIHQRHYEEALKKSCSLSLQNVKFHSAGDKTFDDIGGLHNIKNTLIECLLWPVKYSKIFANSPLRLQSGILLYGPPGSGKTLLAGAAAKHCDLRLISVKGPELLSKYIGASEQAVRDIFDKAQRAKPCILFFDEFDSLAPRRGHDNTGVTDRVVNQLLTQLDGVEALTGVCVLAATSRPDLLDPALLRPGRLDKQLLCPLPTQIDRLEILQILSRKLTLDRDVNLEIIASQTEGYSGADLQAVLYTAQVAAMKNIINEETSGNERVCIDQTTLLEALDQTRPSLTKTERVKYDAIYVRFQGGRTEPVKAGSKVTLA